MNDFYAVIMAGGGGTRLWPLSTQAHPKQMLNLTSEGTLYQLAITRLLGLFDANRILIVTVEDQVAELHAQYPQLPLENFIIEPMPKNTASVVGLAAVAVQKRHPDAVMAVLTSDHLIPNAEGLQALLQAAYTMARQAKLVTLGITPTNPATGYGYIEMGELLADVDGVPCYRVAAFKEKPDLQKAEAFLEAGNYLWNSGMFIWQVKDIMAAFAQQMPALHEALLQISDTWDAENGRQTLARLWQQLEPISIDYGVMEHAHHVAVMPAAQLGWSDIGSWDALFDVLPTDNCGNILMNGAAYSLDTKHTLIYEESSKRLVVTVGVENLIIVDTGKALLICDKSQAQSVREVVKYLKETDQKDYL